MLRRIALIALAVLACFAVSIPAIATTWNLASDYSTTANPNGAWSYGWASNTNNGYTFGLYNICHLYSNMPCWDISQGVCPGLIYNNTGQVQTYGCCSIQPGEAGFHPGSSGETSIYRFTSPASRNYKVGATFYGLSGTCKDVHIIKNRAGGLFDQQIWNSSAYYDGIVSLSSGDTLDFVLGNGDGNYNSDSTTVSATISDTWDAAADFSTTTNDSGTWSYGVASCTSSSFSLLTSSQMPYTNLSGWLYGGNAWALKNYGATNSFDGIWVEAGKVVLLANTPCGKPSDTTTLRWKAPKTAGYNVSVVFRGAYFAPNQPQYLPNANAFVEKTLSQGGPELFRGTIFGFAGKSANGYTDSVGTSPVQSYSGFVSLNSGDTIDFGITNGPDICCNFDCVTVDASITSPLSGSVAGTIRYGSSGDYRVAGATVSAGSGQYSTVTATDGTYSLPVPVGTYTVVCGKSGFADKQQTNVVVTSGQTTTQDLAFDAGRVYGTVTADVTTNNAIGGAVVTSSDGNLSTVTATDGTYSFMLPASTNSVAASKSMYTTVATMAFAISNGGAYQKDFKLRPANPLLSDVALPAPTEWAAPTGAPASPGDTFSPPFLGSSGATSPDAPVIAEWSRTVKPDESFVLTGARFTKRNGADLGTDTTVWVWASGTGGGLRQARIWRVTDNIITAALPSEFTFGMYLVWVENGSGVSTPVCLNRTKSEWVGPLGNIAPSGTTSTKRVFGKNISHNHQEGTSSASYVYVQPAAGGSFTSCSVSSADPYSVTFTVPSLTAGNYNVFVHNGHGGAYGWSEPLPLVVQAAWTRNVRNQVITSTYPNDDTNAIQSALNTMGGYGDGGDVTLNSGSYKISAVISIPAGARLKGAGINNTVLEVRGAQALDYGVALVGNHSALQDLGIYVYNSAYNPNWSVWGAFADDCKLTNVKWNADAGSGSTYIAGYYCPFSNNRCEMSGCVGYRHVAAIGSDLWMHNNTFYGGYYNWQYSAESAISGPGARGVLELNTMQTNWPHNGSNYNYMIDDYTVDTSIIPGGADALDHMVWCKRILLAGGGANSYIARNTGNEVAVQDNKGELILFHGGAGAWFGNAVSCSGNTVNLRTDGYVDVGSGPQAMSVLDDVGVQINGGAPVPDTFGTGRTLEDPNYGVYAMVIGGNGLGQVRKVLSHTRSSITVDKAWRVQLDTTSRLALSFLYKDQIVYKNTLNAFPVGYNQWYSASMDLQIGNGCGCASEGNVSNRTHSSAMILASGLAPTYWNDYRDNAVNSSSTGGLGVGWWSTNPAGDVLLGNRVINSYSQAVGANTSYGAAIDGAGDIVERCTFTGTRIGLVAPTCESMYRANQVTVANNTQLSGWPPAAPNPVGLEFTTSSDNPILVNNTYSSSDYYTNYYASTANSFTCKPVALNRVARFTGFVGASLPEVYVPIANVGTADFTVSMVSKSDSWISTAEIIRGGTLHAEQDAAELLIAIDTTSMPVGTSWGSVTVTDGTKSVKVGVRVDLTGIGPGTNLAGWYKADAGITKDGSNFVGTWADQSGNGKNATQSTQSYKPSWVASAVNSKPSVSFAGNDDYLRTGSLVLAGTTQFSCFSFHKFNSLTLYSSYQRPFWHGGTTTNSGYGYYITTGTAYQKAGWYGSSAVVTDTTAATTGKWCLIDSSYDATRHKMWDNGAYLGSAAKSTSNFTGYLNIGNYATNNNGFNGEMTELMFYSRALSDPERQLVESYLQMKYGAPTASFTANPTSGIAPLTVTFNSSTSSDPERTALSYTWKFGDGTSGTITSTSTSYQYTVPGTYYATLIVTDASGISRTAARQTITVSSGLMAPGKNEQQSSEAPSAVTSSTLALAPALSLTTDPASPISVGGEVGLSARGLSGKMEYEFLAKINDEWTQLQDYSTISTYQWRPTMAGDYTLKVKARRQGTTEEIASPEVAFTVTDFPIDGLSCWLRRDKGVTADPSGLVSKWTDQSRMRASASAEGSSRPLFVNSSDIGPVVRFDGVGAFLHGGADLGYKGGLGVFLVYKAASGAGPSVPVLVGNFGPGNAFRGLELTNNYGFVIGPNRFVSEAEVLRDKLNLLTFTMSDKDGVAELRGNGVRLNSITVDNPTVFGADYFLGGLPGGYWFAGDIAEVLIYNRPLSDNERDAVESYLKVHYALQ